MLPSVGNNVFDQVGAIACSRTQHVVGGRGRGADLCQNEHGF